LIRQTTPPLLRSGFLEHRDDALEIGAAADPWENICAVVLFAGLD
jgi:hypothetical protein